MEHLPDEVSDELVVTMGLLKAHDRQLIVVNVPVAARAELSAAGVDVSATTDRVYIDDPDVNLDPESFDEAFYRILLP